MSSDREYTQAFHHITTVWLQTETSEVGLLLRHGRIGNLRRLRTYLRHPGLLDGTYPDEDGDQIGLEEERKEELGGIHSYMNYLQNQWGPDYDGMFDWSTKSRADYEMFLANHPPSEFPIEFNLEVAEASKLQRQAQEASQHSRNNNSAGSEPPTSIGGSTSTHHTNRTLYN